MGPCRAAMGPPWGCGTHMGCPLPPPGLGMENIGGIFVVLVGGLVLAVLVALVEFVWASRRSAEREEVRGAMGGGRWGGAVMGSAVGWWDIGGH